MKHVLDGLINGIDRVLPEAASLRRAIHADPHLGGDEGDTRDQITAAAAWLDWHPIAETGAYARLGAAGPAVAMRAELDALPIIEATGVEWSSGRRGIMHACGHDVHMAALWAVLQAARDVELPTGLVAVLQPREEVTPPGASDVVSSGILDDEDIRAFVGVHVQPLIERGTVSTGAGAINAAFDSFEITIHGRGGHGAYPHESVDPIGVLATVIVGLRDLAARTVDPTHPTVVSVGSVHAGTGANIIADEATCRGTIRTYSEADRQALHQAIALLAEGTALGRGASATTTFERGGPALVNDPALVTRVDRWLADSGVPMAGVPFRSCGSDDFAEYSQVAPSLMAFVGTGSSDGVGLHHGAFLPGRDSLRLAAVSLAAAYVGAAELVGHGG
ncbi:MAG: M20 family metallopeptidase [Arachnia sp.]